MKTTTNYDLFSFIEGNRDVDLTNTRTKTLAESMVEYGWLDAYPLMVKENGGDTLIVMDGQHRLQIAKEFGIPVKYITEKQDIDITKINSSSKSWTTLDFVNKFAQEENVHYATLLKFHSENPIGLSTCAVLLSNGTASGRVIRNGLYVIKTPTEAREVVGVWYRLIEIEPSMKKTGAVRALWSCYHLDYFDADRLIEGAQKYEKINREVTSTGGFLELFEDIYNFHKKVKFPLKFDAQQSTKMRNPLIAKAINSRQT